MPLTDSKIKALQPSDRLVRHSDGRGLFLDVSPKGTKTFRYQFQAQGNRRTMTLGEYPEMKLTDARAEAARIKDALRRGEVPASSRASAAEVAAPRNPSDTADDGRLWRTLADAYIKYRRRDGAAWRTMAKLERQVGATIEALGDKYVDEITATDILEMLRPIEDKGLIDTAHETRTRCSQIFRFAEAQGYPNTDPAKVTIGAMVKRRRGSFAGVTDPAEVGGLIRAIRAYETHQPRVRAALLLSGYLFPRNTELRGMLWSEIDWKQKIWEIPGERMKMGRDHIVPLPRQAIEALHELQPWTGRSRFVIPAPRDFDGMVSDNTFNKALRRMGYVQNKHVHHGFRTTASTTLNELGFNRDWTERQLAHVEENKVRGTYCKAQHLPGRTEMMQVYADWLDKQANLETVKTDLLGESGEHQLRKLEVFHGKREQTDTGVSA